MALPQLPQPEPRDHAHHVAALQSALCRQGQIFAEAVESLGRRELSADGDVTVQGLEHLEKTLDRIMRVQSEVTAARERLHQAGGVVSEELSETLSSQATLLQTLLSQVDLIRENLELQKSSAIPQMESDTRRRTMHQAYSQSLRTM